MPTPAPAPSARPSVPTTYSGLTSAAATHLAQALVTADTDPPSGLPALRDALTAHRHLTAMLGHLGTVLQAPLPGQEPEAGRPQRRRPRRPDAALAAALSALGGRRDWEAATHSADPAAPAPLAGDLLAAARLVGAAADLWATHHDAAGAPRSQEASRLRHPATLGAAVREWRALVVVTGAVVDALARPAGVAAPDDEDWRDLREYAGAYPQPALRPSDPRGPVTVTVAHPPRPRSDDPLTAIEQAVRFLQRTSWRLATTGTAPIPIVANLTAIGVMLARAACLAGQCAAAGADGTAAARYRAAAVRGRATEEGWRRAAAAVSPLRSAHPATTSIQVERLELKRLVDRVTGSGGGTVDWPHVAEVLLRVSREYEVVAGHLAEALAGAHARGDVLLDGRALPHESLARRPDLLQAKLRGWVVPAPTAAVGRAEAALRDLVSAHGDEAAPDGSPAA
jgi:hypothetical protein